MDARTPVNGWLRAVVDASAQLCMVGHARSERGWCTRDGAPGRDQLPPGESVPCGGVWLAGCAFTATARICPLVGRGAKVLEFWGTFDLPDKVKMAIWQLAASLQLRAARQLPGSVCRVAASNCRGTRAPRH